MSEKGITEDVNVDLKFNGKGEPDLITLYKEVYPKTLQYLQTMFQRKKVKCTKKQTKMPIGKHAHTHTHRNSLKRGTSIKHGKNITLNQPKKCGSIVSNLVMTRLLVCWVNGGLRTLEVRTGMSS